MEIVEEFDPSDEVIDIFMILVVVEVGVGGAKVEPLLQECFFCLCKVVMGEIEHTGRGWSVCL